MFMMTSQILKLLHLSKTRKCKYLTNETLISSSNKKIHSLYIDNCCMTKNNFPVEITLNPLSANFIEWSNTLKQFVGNLPTNCLRVFGLFVRLALRGLNFKWQWTYWQVIYHVHWHCIGSFELQRRKNLVKRLRWRYFLKTRHLIWLTGVWMCLWNLAWFCLLGITFL